MSIAFLTITFASLVAIIIHSPEAAFPAMIDGVGQAITLIIKLAAIYAVWLSVLDMAQKTKLDKKLSKLLKPLTRKIFKNESEEAYEWICINLSANMLGMGGVATPAGIKAMHAMEDGSQKATDNMIMLLVINATSIQLIPATVVAMRASNGSQSASDIILPTLISSGIATLCGMIICKVLSIKKQPDKNTHFDNISVLSTKNNNIKPSFCNLRHKNTKPCPRRKDKDAKPSSRTLHTDKHKTFSFNFRHNSSVRKGK